MADEPNANTVTEKKSKFPLLLGILLMLLLGGGGFFAVYSGHLLTSDTKEDPVEVAAPMPNVVFVPISPLIVNLISQSGQPRHLRFQAQLEVAPQYEQEIRALLPRIVDVLNGYLRAVDVAELENPSALIRLRAQILRRFQIVAGEGRVNDLLIMEFVVN